MDTKINMLLKNLAGKSNLLDFLDSSDQFSLNKIFFELKDLVSSELRASFIFIELDESSKSVLDKLKIIVESNTVVVIASTVQYAPLAFELGAYDFLLFNDKKNRLEQVFNRLQRKSSTADFGNRFFVRRRNEYLSFLLSEIYFFKSDGDYIILYLSENRVFRFHGRLRDIEIRLTGKGFFRVHRSYIIRMVEIKAIGKKEIIVGEHTIPVTFPRKKELKAEIKAVLFG